MLRNEKGFTLIEIIAVLVILGILAAVAIPKYLSMMDESRIAAAQGAIGEAKGRCSGYYANQLLAQTTPNVSNVLNSLTANGGPDLGSDFTVGAGLAAGSSNIVITVSAVKGVAVNVVGTWYMPTP
jgi:MSHA pilin protein MshA